MSAATLPLARDPLRAGPVLPLVSYLSALQLCDSAFPTGRYTLSYGLETLTQSRQLRPGSPRSAFVALLTGCIRFGVGLSDGVALACAHRALHPDGSIDLELATSADERLTAVKLAREARDASTRTGRALLASARVAFGDALPPQYSELVTHGRSPGNHAVVLGLLSARLGLSRLEAVAGDLYAFSVSWVAAAVRLGLLDHGSAQAVLYRVHEATAAAAVKAVDQDVTHISSCTPLLDVMAMRHEEAELRMFAS
jgi:urease accessory protein